MLTASEKIQKRGERLATRRVKRSAAKKMLLNSDLPVEQIANYLDMAVKDVEEIRKSLQPSKRRKK